MRRGVAAFTLDSGRCPPWLFERMVRLGREIVEILVAELSPDEFIRRIADPVWFQSLGTVLAFDWNASGLTTILTAALKEAIRGRERELGIFICGGKGKTSLRTPDEIEAWGERLCLPGGVVGNLTYNSKMAAKVDSSLLQDGYELYHHVFFFSLKRGHAQTLRGQTQTVKGSDNFSVGSWAVVQQGMNRENQTARRYHWFSENVRDLVCEPHSGIASQVRMPALDMTAEKSGKTRAMSVEFVGGGYVSLMKDIEILRRHSSCLSQMLTLRHRAPDGSAASAQEATGKQSQLFTYLNLENTEFRHHDVEFEDFSKSRYLEKILAKVAYEKPATYEAFVATPGVGAKTVRALALVSEVIYGAAPSYEDPARYSFAFGGKDATPYPVDRPTYDTSIEILKRAVEKSRAYKDEKNRILQRLEYRVTPDQS